MAPHKQEWSPRDYPEPKTKDQPIWEFLRNLGDEDPLEHGGFFVYRDKTGAYAEEIEHLTPMIDRSFLVYRTPIDRLKLVDGYLVPLRYRPEWRHPLEQYDEWFHEKLDEVAHSIGSTKEELETDFTSPDPIRRAWAYQAVGEHFGWENFDSYPLRLTRAEVKKRFRKELKA